MENKVTCIVCPIGCRMTVTKLNDGGYTVEGNTCKRGEKYGVEELTAPKRVVTTTVRINNGILNLLPVKTKDSIPKELVFELMELLDSVRLQAPVKVGDIVVKNALDTGVDIVAARDMERV